MKLALASLQPNPMRDFVVDPVDNSQVEAIIHSINQDGFWGGVVCRQVGSEFQIAAGHHRIAAAIAAGITHADLFVGNFDDDAMVRIYARENATQRGNGSTAVAGSIAATVRCLVRKELLTPENRSQEHGGNRSGQIGSPAILKFLEGVPNVSKPTVEQQLANIKASGDYSRIVHEVTAEVEAEVEAEQERLRQQEAAAKNEAEREEVKQKEQEQSRRSEKARKTAEKAEKVPVTFDFSGVASHLKNENQVAVFRDVATREDVRKLLPVDQQANVAQQLVVMASESGRELSGAFIREFFGAAIQRLKWGKREAEKKSRDEQAEKMSRNEKFKIEQREFSAGARKMEAAGVAIADMFRDWPKDEQLPAFTQEFTTAVKRLASIVELLKRHGLM